MNLGLGLGLSSKDRWETMDSSIWLWINDYWVSEINWSTDRSSRPASDGNAVVKCSDHERTFRFDSARLGLNVMSQRARRKLICWFIFVFFNFQWMQSRSRTGLTRAGLGWTGLGQFANLRRSSVVCLTKGPSLMVSQSVGWPVILGLLLGIAQTKRKNSESKRKSQRASDGMGWKSRTYLIFIYSSSFFLSGLLLFFTLLGKSWPQSRSSLAEPSPVHIEGENE